MHQRRNNDPTDAGFTLIELLVVIIIIGILAAIAIPIFLNQRSKGYDATAQSDVKWLAENQEVYLLDNQTYAPIANLTGAGQDIRVSNGVTVSVVRFDGGNSFCLSSKHQGSSQTFYWDSLAGGLQPAGSAGCPAATIGVAGDSLTG